VRAYRQIGAEHEVALLAPPTSWTEWARRLTALANEGKFQEELDFWLQATPASTPLPADGDSAIKNTEANARFVTVTLDPARTDSLLRSVHRAYQTKIGDVLLTALLRAVNVETGRRDLLLTLERHGREGIDPQLDAAHTVGWFTSLFPVTLRLGDADDPGANLVQIKKQLSRVSQHGIGYGVLRYAAEAKIQEQLATQPQPEILFNYLGQVDAIAEPDSLFQPVMGDVGPAYGPQNQRTHLLDINARIQDGQLHVTWQYASSQFSAGSLEQLAEVYLSQLAQLIDHCTGVETAEPSQAVVESYALSPMQRLMLLHAMTVHHGQDVLFNQIVYRLDGPLDPKAFQGAWQQAVDRHPALRTRFIWPDYKEPRQEVIASAVLPWAVHDWRGEDITTQAARLEELLTADRSEGFNLEQAPLQRLILIRRSAQEYWLVWSSHHLILDRWCIGLILDDIARVYAALIARETAVLPPPAGYGAYITWLDQQDEVGAQDFWRAALKDLTARPLPWLANGNPMTGSGDIKAYTVELSADETAALQQFALDYDLTLGTLVPAAWGVVIGAATQSNDVLFGLTVSGRPAELPGVTGIVGSFINNVPLRLTLPTNTPLASWLRSVQSAQLSMQQHEYASPAQIQAWRGERAYGLLFDSLVVVQAPVRYDMPAGLELHFERGGLQTGYPVSLEVVPEADRLRLVLTIDRRQVPAVAAEQLIDGLRQVLRAMPELAAEPGIALQQRVQIEKIKAPAPQPRSTEAAPDTARLLPGSSVESRLLEMWRTVLRQDRLSMGDDFFALGGTSLQAMQLVMQMEKGFGARLPLTSFLKETTVASLAAEIGQHVDARVWPLVVDIQPLGERPPFFCVHGLTGDVLWFRELGDRMAPDQPFYGLQSQGLDGIQPPVDDLQKMAALYIDALRTRQPKGPYYLGGASFGGTVALEMAQQLHAQGDEVALLVMFDHVPGADQVDGGRWGPVQQAWSRLRNAPYWLASFVELGPVRIWLRARRKTQVAIKGIAQRLGFRSEDRVISTDMIDYADQLPEHRQQLIEAHARAILTYQPARYSGRSVWFKARVQPLLHRTGGEQIWHALGGDEENIILVPGSHEGMFQQPHVTTLAAELQAQLALVRRADEE
jgi:non-ribosomal peptide synthase protein (TIGR01720 family)